MGANIIDIQVKCDDFDAYQTLSDFHQQHKTDDDALQQGALCHFMGMMRGFNQQGEKLLSMNLEHYSGMCEKILQQIGSELMKNFTINHLLLFHRSGIIYPGQVILLLAVSASHRKEAFEACQFMADRLKIEAPFWKEEVTEAGEANWVQQKQSDLLQQEKWYDACREKIS